MDESGDMGFSNKSSKWFLFTLAIVDDARVLEKVIKKVWKTLRKKHKNISELHAFQEQDVTRIRILRLLSEIDDLKIVAIILNKTKVHINLQEQKNYLYNYTANLVLDRLINKKVLNKDNKIFLVVDRKDTKKNLRNNFISYITNSMKIRKHDKFEMTLVASHDNKCLQAVDFISWAIFRKYERGDFEYYEIVRNRIIDEKLLFL